MVGIRVFDRCTINQCKFKFDDQGQYHSGFVHSLLVWLLECTVHAEAFDLLSVEKFQTGVFV